MKWFTDNHVIECNQDLEWSEVVWCKERYRLFGVAEGHLVGGRKYVVRRYIPNESFVAQQMIPPDITSESVDVESSDKVVSDDDDINDVPLGVWMCFHWDRSCCIPFATEIEALRYACENKTEVRYVEYGHEVIQG